MWGVVAAHLTNNWGYYVMLMWLPTYLRDRLNVDLHQMGMLSVLPYLLMYACSNTSGYVADRWIAQGVAIVTVRVRVEAMAKLVPCGCFVVLAVVEMGQVPEP